MLSGLMRPSPTPLFLLLILTFGSMGCESSEDSESLPSEEAVQGLDSSMEGSEATVDGVDELEELVQDIVEDTEALPCIPDCEGKLCGDDGCGVLCGVCDEGYSCTEDGQCDLYCEPQVSTTCVGNATYWVNGCGDANELKEECSTGTQCEEGICMPCTPQSAMTCDGNARMWMDSCENPGETVEECGEDSLCVDGECVQAENPLSGQFEITVTPNDLDFAGLGLVTSFPDGTVSLLIDGADNVTISLGTGMESIGEQIPQLLGTLVADQFSAGGTLTTSLEGGDSLERSFMIQGLFVNSDQFQGTLKEWLIVNNEGPPTEGIRDITASRIIP